MTYYLIGIVRVRTKATEISLVYLITFSLLSWTYSVYRKLSEQTAANFLHNINCLVFLRKFSVFPQIINYIYVCTSICVWVFIYIYMYIYIYIYIYDV